MKTITQERFKQQCKAFCLSNPFINPYNFNHSHGVPPRGRVVKGVQEIKIETPINGILRTVSRFISHLIGYKKKR